MKRNLRSLVKPFKVSADDGGDRSDEIRLGNDGVAALGRLALRDVNAFAGRLRNDAAKRLAHAVRKRLREGLVDGGGITDRCGLRVRVVGGLFGLDK